MRDCGEVILEERGVASHRTMSRVIFPISQLLVRPVLRLSSWHRRSCPSTSSSGEEVFLLSFLQLLGVSEGHCLLRAVGDLASLIEDRKEDEDENTHHRVAHNGRDCPDGQSCLHL